MNKSDGGKLNKTWLCRKLCRQNMKQGILQMYGYIRTMYFLQPFHVTH